MKNIQQYKIDILS